MNVKKLFGRFVSLITVLCMSMAVASTTVSAAEAPTPETPETPVIVDESVGQVLVSGSADFVNSTTIYLYLSSGNWSADCLAVVTGNPGAIYEVVMTTPGGSSSTAYVTSNSGVFTNIVTLSYASSGTYKFKFTRISGSAVTAHARAEICD